jgi:predicted dehydrogenase
MSQIKTAVLGVGYLGFFHAQKHKASNLSDFVGVFDVSADRSKKVATDLGCESFTELIQLKGRVDAVTIAASTQAHFEIAMWCLQNGIHVNVEKPIAAEVHQADQMISLAKKNNLKLSVGHIERFNPCFDEIKKQNFLADSLVFRRQGPFKTRATDVSVLHDLMIHDVDLLTWLTGSEIQSAHVVKRKVFTETWDWSEVHVNLNSGQTASLIASRVTPTADRSLQLIRKDETLWAHMGTLELQHSKLIDLKNPEPVSLKTWSAEKRDALQQETDEFLKCIINDSPAPVSGEDAMQALSWIEKWSQ